MVVVMAGGAAVNGADAGRDSGAGAGGGSGSDDRDRDRDGDGDGVVDDGSDADTDGGWCVDAY